MFCPTIIFSNLPFLLQLDIIFTMAFTLKHCQSLQCPIFNSSTFELPAGQTVMITPEKK